MEDGGLALAKRIKNTAQNFRLTIQYIAEIGRIDQLLSGDASLCNGNTKRDRVDLAGSKHNFVVRHNLIGIEQLD